MAKVVVKVGDVCEGGMDLTVFPCSAKGSISSRMAAKTALYDLKSPDDLKLTLSHGQISQPFPFPSQGDRKRPSKHYLYAAAVFNKQSSYEILKGIGEQLGSLTTTRPDLVYCESVLLGTGAGNVPTSIAGRALCDGFFSTASEKATLFIFASDSTTHDAVVGSLKTGVLGHAWDATEIKFNLGIFSFDLKKFATKLCTPK